MIGMGIAVRRVIAGLAITAGLAAALPAITQDAGA